MIRQVGRLLSISDVDEMVFLTEQSQDLLKETEYQERPFYYLMITLEKQGKVTESNLDLLVECLKELQCKEAIQLVESYKMSISPGQVESTDLQQEPSEGDDINYSIQPYFAPEPQQHQDTKKQQQKQLLRDKCQMFKPQKSFPACTWEDAEPIFQHEYLERHQQHSYFHYDTKTGKMLGKNETQRETLTCTWEDVKPMIHALGMDTASDHTFNIMDCMKLQTVHLLSDNTSTKSVIMNFLTRVISFDHRAWKVFKDLKFNLDDSLASQIKFENQLSCRDVICAFLNSCDPFLRQEILSKMAACQLAVPVLLPDVKHGTVSLLLWGLQRISKAWFDRKASKILEQTIIKFPFPVVSFLRFGHNGLSKSNILNKMLGSTQGNDDHPYFTSNEQDKRISKISHGALEAVWYLANLGEEGSYSLTEALCFLNLRGDAKEFPVQQYFIGEYSSVTIVFVSHADLSEAKAMLDTLAEKSTLISAVNGDGCSYFSAREDDRKAQIKPADRYTQIDLTGLSTLEISERLCTEIKRILSHPDRKRILTLADSVAFCSTPDFKIDVDILGKECNDAKQIAKVILQSTSKGSKQYKHDSLPLQNIWLKWSQLDKDRTWKGDESNSEKQLTRLHKEKQDQRKRQRQVGVSEQMKTMYKTLSCSTASFKQFLVFWLEYYLNELSNDTLRPLVDNLKEVSYNAREVAAEITQLKRQLSTSSILEREKEYLENKIKEMTARESKLQQELSKQTKEFDAYSLGFEHFVREFGQIYECFQNYDAPMSSDSSGPPFDVSHLPYLAAEFLLSGHPLEIFDGDACHVPIKWVTSILKAIRDKTGNSRIYVISVIGIQSSGKSTLLNCMFGVRFAVSAGRCTRGVFLQLLPLSDDLKLKLECDFVAVIDTEGLKAPEKSLSNRKNEDNELATFALCISDMTLINIGGQTVGEELSNILQISAHAFIRMKEVHLKSSCYLIQQFVADITARYRNQGSTESILRKLDQAVKTAAVEESKEDQYRQFSDCFNIINVGNDVDKVQYIPSLWRGSMAAPNHEYSEVVLRLKSELLQEIKSGPKQTIAEFSNRIVSVWNAVKEEDFVFNFRNSNEIAQYNNFTRWYMREQLKLTQDMLKWELDAKTKIRNQAAGNIQDCQEALFIQLQVKVDAEVERMQSAVDEILQNREFECVKHHDTYFSRDIILRGNQIRETVRNAINLEATVIINAKTKDNLLLPTIKAKLRHQVLPLAESLQLKLLQNDDSNLNRDLTPEEENLVIAAFEEEWTKQIKGVQLQHPMKSEEQIRQSIDSSLTERIVESLKNMDLSKEMKQQLENVKLSEFCQKPPQIKCVEDIHEFSHLCSKSLTKHLNNLQESVSDKVKKNGFCFSKQFVSGLRKAVSHVRSDPCPGCKPRTDILLCVLCYALQTAHEATERTVLEKIMEDKQLKESFNIEGVSSYTEIQTDVKSHLTDMGQNTSTSFFQKVKNLMSWNSDCEMERNFNRRLDEYFVQRIKNLRKEKWYSGTETARVFIEKAISLLDDCNAPQNKYLQLLDKACTSFVEQAAESEMHFVRKRLPWDKVKELIKIEAISILDQRDIFINSLTDVLPEPVVSAWRAMSVETIAKYARIPLSEDVRHVIDGKLIALLPDLSQTKYQKVLSGIREARNIFLGIIKESGVYNEIVGTALVTNTYKEVSNTDLGKLEQAVTMVHVFSWALHICIGMTIIFERNHSILTLLKEEKEPLYSDFKSLCKGVRQDQLAAKSLCASLEVSLHEVLRNRLCSSLFEKLSSAGNGIFCSRPRFLKTALERMCEDESFDQYKRFLHKHYSFIKEWALEFIAMECCKPSADHVSVREIAIHEIGHILHETEMSFTAALQSVKKDKIADDLFEVWIKSFVNTLASSTTCILSEDKIALLRNYHEITDFALLTKECIKVTKSFQEGVLLESLHLPDFRSKTKIVEWFQNHLPTPLHVLLSNSIRGCGSQCPFCDTFCDDTVKEHKVHFSNLHFPSGIGGVKNRRTRKLQPSTCVANVATDKSFYNCGCEYESFCKHPGIPYRNYKQLFPDWDIRPISDYQPTIYWKWVLSRFNKEFATYYKAKPADIPWGHITKREALASIRQIYSLELPDDFM
ncbi:Interferon-induced very large GTPase 1 [Holothuria leucospilota]|uniref:Interferon-induced very large GTPase 1 n=1 Tax=Holothuria leucospilota TaxID=206669 RepID=A0A9Q1C9Y6_HOLLE|nr:Interferon-induced very large GTPase 1 [Holothuria leucospilota]